MWMMTLGPIWELQALFPLLVELLPSLVLAWWWAVGLLRVQVLASVGASWPLLTLSLSPGHLCPGRIVGSELVEWVVVLIVWVGWVAIAAFPRSSRVGVLTI